MTSNPDEVMSANRVRQTVSSELIAKYKTLGQLLAQQKWREADWETRRLMLSIAGADRRKDCLLTETDIRNFPCQDLHILDRLWVKYSQGRFGFSVIAQIYQDLEHDYTQLAQTVGWRNGDQWVNYNELNFTNSAPIGHLPITWLVPTTFSMYWLARFASAGWRLLLERSIECKLTSSRTKRN